MRNMIKSIVVAVVLSAGAFSLGPSTASAGVVGLSDQQAVAPASATEKVCYFHRHYRHWGYHRRHYRHWGYYRYAYPYRYYGYANPIGAALTLATWPLWGWWW